VRSLTRCSCGQSNKMFFILTSVPVTSVTEPELIRPSIFVVTHSLDQKVVARKAKARKCTAQVAGNVQAKVERQHRLLISFFVIPPSRSIRQRYTKMCVICPQNPAGMMSFMWCQVVKISPAPIFFFLVGVVTRSSARA